MNRVPVELQLDISNSCHVVRSKIQLKLFILYILFFCGIHIGCFDTHCTCPDTCDLILLSYLPACARGWDWYAGYQHKFMSIKSMSLLKPGATRCHGTRIARGVPLPVYNNLDLYSGFWCTSRCVVF